MIAHTHFTWVHVPKTGGHSVSRALTPYPGVHGITFTHAPWEVSGQQGVPVLAFVRNPWHYYISLYNQMRRDLNQGHYRGWILEEVFRKPFEEATLHALSLHASMFENLRKLTGFQSPRAPEKLVIKRFEDGLEKGLNDFLVSQGLQSVKLTRENRSVKRYATVFSEPLVEVIRQREAPVFKAFGYSEEPPSPSKENPSNDR